MAKPTRLYFCSKRFDRLSEQDLKRLGTYKPNPELMDSDGRAVLFSISPFSLSEETESECSGVAYQSAPSLWEVEPPSKFKDAYELVEGAEERAKDRSTRTLIRLRLRKYLQDFRVELQVRKSVMDNVIWLLKQEKPCYAEPGPKAAEIRMKLMVALHELRHADPKLATSVMEHFSTSGDEYTPDLIESAFRGEKAFQHDGKTFGA